MVYQEIEKIPMGTNCVTFIADLFLYFVMRGIICLTCTNLNGIPLDILTIYLPLIILNLRIIFPIYIHQNFKNKANATNKETFLLKLNIKYIGSDDNTNVNDKHEDFGFTIVNFTWVSGEFLAFLDFHLIVFIVNVSTF